MATTGNNPAAQIIMALAFEVADKMSTIPEMWWQTAFIAFMLISFFVWTRALQCLGLMAAFGVSAFLVYFTYDLVYVDLNMGAAIRRELGPIWVRHAFASACLPVVAASLPFCIRSSWLRFRGGVSVLQGEIS